MMTYEELLRQHFPLLNNSNQLCTSVRTDKYNCIAWAAGDDDNWWWPDEFSFWPEKAPRELTMEAFAAAYRTLGYAECENGNHEQGYEKIAIYSTSEGPQHAARQLPDGNWTSKLGPYEDITHHDLRGVECKTYGSVSFFMKRSIGTKVTHDDDMRVHTEPASN